MMPHSLTYWPPAGNDGYGRLSFAAPTYPVKARWQDTQKLFRDAQGRDVMSEAIVYPASELAIAGYVALGDQTAQADPRELADAREIRQSGASPSLDGSETLYKVWL